jgi:hypothetical protein|tara:strand:- start:4588 stop:4794 length:207 start_codon:yes stop_codon:yes gene_type:complete
LGQNPNNFQFPKGKMTVKSKKTNSKLNQAQTDASKSKPESEVKIQSKEKAKINHNKFYRALEAFSDCV